MTNRLGRARVAVIGAGVIGLLFALRCADDCVSVEVFDAESLPNEKGRSIDISRLFRIVHPSNGPLQALSLRSLPFWLKWDRESGGQRLIPIDCYRSLDEPGLALALQQYEALGLPWRVYEAGEANPLTRHYRFPENRRLLAGGDSYILNSRAILLDMIEKVRSRPNVNLRTCCRVDDVTEQTHGVLSVTHAGGSTEFDAVFIATGDPTLAVKLCAADQSPKPEARTQFYVNVRLDDQQHGAPLPPLLDFGDAMGTWTVPGFDPHWLKVSAARLTLAEETYSGGVEALIDSLLAMLKHRTTRIEPRFMTYYEHPHRIEREISYVKKTALTHVYALEACDAVLFKAAPAITDALYHTIFEA
ncbi:FAD-binding oxidoreductase [Burkholderia sp. AU30280]|uniref:FAD-dependent oxidoreductase n=1 Tax=Burkholderia sp. AU30280 TaxID=2879628 RepID=UPI001CF489C6|nr:FAD-dependent oxidoreductase [Burkholderia sp. AU30280]MCA8276388.1 FAD-binding oxidoreductase [Burkholderia sp. AU30280]